MIFIIRKIYNCAPILPFYQSWNAQRKIEPESYKCLYVECVYSTCMHKKNVVYTLHILRVTLSARYTHK